MPVLAGGKGGFEYATGKTGISRQGAKVYKCAGGECKN